MEERLDKIASGNEDWRDWLKVTDLAFIPMCEENDIETVIFAIDQQESMLNAIDNIGKFTIIKNK